MRQGDAPPVASPGDAGQTWSTLLARYRGDAEPWLIVPDDSVVNDACRTVTRAQLSEDALGVAAGLCALGGRAGDRVVVVADNSVECAVLIFGVLAAGMVVVPVAPRLAARRALSGSATARVVTDSEARFAIGRADALRLEFRDVPLPSGVQVRDFEELVAHPAAEIRVAPKADDLALLQYTSGTTARPRGVELTHANLQYNIGALAEDVRPQPGEVALCWLPLFHDMGLVGSLLASTVWELSIVLMKPASFVVRPESWLWAISRFRVMGCAAPNSAYQTCATRIPDRRLVGLDLSSWRVAFNGAELIQPHTIEAFCQRFAPYGFRAEAMHPVYGLAENTVAATGKTLGRRTKVDWVDREQLETDGRAIEQEEGEGRGVTSVGRAISGHTLRVVDVTTGEVLPDRFVGDIELRGPCVMRGYRGMPDETARVLGEDGWLRTGDRGYMVDGELYVVGRVKHIVKRGGRTYDASDIAGALQGVAGIHRGAVAVFGVPDPHTGTDALVVIAETRAAGDDKRRALSEAVRLTVQEAFALRPDVVVLDKPGTIPRTTSGKVQHSVACENYLRERHQEHSPASTFTPCRPQRDGSDGSH